MSDSTEGGGGFEVMPMPPNPGIFVGEQTDWKKIWEVFRTSTIGKILVQEIIKMAIEKAVMWAIEDFSK